ncbi:adenylate/guanylate cyclase domain-containing protein [Parapedobacter tibetensis]|uniref:adenylate/guanylate cyclase domain-containing protein n=1 Tax=Parapedobacter tibetensis TaxID=2972951 RepID=UPI00214D76FB|nr:adenylate/guanylate cyclase domain-containing protein [Parapedobacter tibetensis]
MVNVKTERLLKEVNSVLGHVSNALEAERSSFFLINRPLSILESIVAQGIENLTLSIPIGTGIVGRVAESGVAILENDVQSSPIFDHSVDVQLNFTTKSVVCVPVFDDIGNTIGALQCLNSTRGEFEEKDIRVLGSFAHTIGAIVKSTKLYHASDQLKNSYSTLLNVFGAVTSEFDLDHLIPLIMSKAAQITQADRSSLFFLDDDTGELWTKYAKGLETETIRTKKGIVGLVAKSGKPCIVNNPYQHPHFDASIDLKTGYKTASILSIPIFRSNNQILGVIQAINKIGGPFKLSDLSILEGFASQIRIAIENAQLFRQINGMKNYLNILVENLDNGIVTIDKADKIQTVNSAFYRIFGLDRNQSLGNRKINNLDTGLFSLLSHSHHTMATGKKHYEYGLEFMTEKSKNIVTNLSILPMQDTNGAIIGAINVFHDVTKEKRIHANLSRYIPQHIVNEVINKDDLSILQSKNRKCSILFSDIRNFTKLTEELGAPQIVELLNRYFDAMVTSIHKHHGILDKFIGDAVMAVFGVPYTNSSDAVNAITCALDMFRVIEETNKNQNGNVELNIGIGISTGYVVSGNIGSEKRYEYTVIGDPVNLAARLESETKKYGVKILICENTYQQVSTEFECKAIDTVLLKGKQHPVKIYTVLGHNTEKP